MQTIIKTYMAFVFLFAAGAAYARSGLKCPEAELSEDQKAAVRAIWRGFREAAEGRPRAERRELKAAARADILNIASSDAQRAALAECQSRRGGQRGFCPEAELSKEQKKAVRALRRGFKEAKEGRSKAERRDLRAALWEDILNIASSDAQRAALAECQSQRRNRRQRQN